MIGDIKSPTRIILWGLMYFNITKRYCGRADAQPDSTLMSVIATRASPVM